MKTILLAIFIAIFTATTSFGTSTIPFKVSKITVDYGQGRKAIFSFDIGGLAHGDKRHKIPKVVAVEFVFSNGTTAKISAEGLKGIEIIDIHSTMIETGVKKGSWFLTTRIKNVKKLDDRVANDWVVFVFKAYKYERRWLERNSPRNALITQAEQGVAPDG
ncbi:hypothetical protein HW115_18840 [Verrucomicrobiaceae bacterium N1E253]|uniref:Uncharacterized protein n=1 Tax=Oceaniferula marina TaxID=2748318 RepID=A0A851GKV6_9BACT|nr:hypothetical protein [Oceaniferula marina]NWK57682.1 hypothetical protein [Oceaniferula marina]